MMEKLKKVSRTQWCLFALLIGFAFLMQNCEDDDTIVQYTLTTEVTPALSGSIAPSSGTFDEGTVISLTATPASEYVFKNWSNGASGSENPLLVIMNSDKNITAVFEKKNYSLNIVIVGEGTVTEEIIQAKSAGDYPSGTIVKLTAVPSEGWVFDKWNGHYEGTENPLQLTIDKPTSITAKFEKKNYPLNVVIVGQGTVTEEVIQAKSSVDYPSGTIVKLTAVPSAGWLFNGWSGDSQGTQNPLQITISKPTTLTATFLGPTPKTYIPDNNFEQALIALGYDNVLDNYVNTNAINQIDYLQIDSKNISDLTGIEDFVNLKILNCQNNLLTSIDISKNINLIFFICSNNQLTSLDVSKLIYLRFLDCSYNQISSLDVYNLIDLLELVCSHNQLTSLNVSNNTKLLTLFCPSNQLSSLDISNNAVLGTVPGYSLLDCTNNPLLECIQISEQQLTGIDPLIYYWHKDATAIYSLDCSSN